MADPEAEEYYSTTLRHYSPLYGLDGFARRKRDIEISRCFQTEGPTSYIWGNDMPEFRPLLSAVQIVQIACGSQHCGFLSASGQLYTYGGNDVFQCGLGDDAAPYVSEPTLVSSLVQKTVTSVMCGPGQSAALTEDDVLHFWGVDAVTQKRVAKPSPFRHWSKIGERKKLMQLHFGPQHVTVLVRNMGRSGSMATEVWAWGASNRGQLGLSDENWGGIGPSNMTPRGGKSDVKRHPLLVTALFGKHVIQLAGSESHMAALTYDGDLYLWGQNRHGALGVNSGSYVVGLPSIVPGLEEVYGASVSCGDDFTVLMSKEGHVYTWGLGERGQLGHGDRETRLVPTVIESLREEGHFALSAYCGSAHSCIVTSETLALFFGGGSDFAINPVSEEDALSPTELAANPVGLGLGSNFTVAVFGELQRISDIPELQEENAEALPDLRAMAPKSSPPPTSKEGTRKQVKIRNDSKTLLDDLPDSDEEEDTKHSLGRNTSNAFSWIKDVDTSTLKPEAPNYVATKEVEADVSISRSDPAVQSVETDPPTATSASVPPTATFDLAPPTATFDLAPPTATFNSAPPTTTLDSPSSPAQTEQARTPPSSSVPAARGESLMRPSPSMPTKLSEGGTSSAKGQPAALLSLPPVVEADPSPGKPPALVSGRRSPRNPSPRKPTPGKPSQKPPGIVPVGRKPRPKSSMSTAGQRPPGRELPPALIDGGTQPPPLRQKAPTLGSGPPPAGVPPPVSPRTLSRMTSEGSLTNIRVSKRGRGRGRGRGAVADSRATGPPAPLPPAGQPRPKHFPANTPPPLVPPPVQPARPPQGSKRPLVPFQAATDVPSPQGSAPPRGPPPLRGPPPAVAPIPGRLMADPSRSRSKTSLEYSPRSGGVPPPLSPGASQKRFSNLPPPPQRIPSNAGVARGQGKTPILRLNSGSRPVPAPIPPAPTAFGRNVSGNQSIIALPKRVMNDAAKLPIRLTIIKAEGFKGELDARVRLSQSRSSSQMDSDSTHPVFGAKKSAEWNQEFELYVTPSHSTWFLNLESVGVKEKTPRTLGRFSLHVLGMKNLKANVVEHMSLRDLDHGTVHLRISLLTVDWSPSVLMNGTANPEAGGDLNMTDKSALAVTPSNSLTPVGKTSSNSVSEAPVGRPQKKRQNRKRMSMYITGGLKKDKLELSGPTNFQHVENSGGEQPKAPHALKSAPSPLTASADTGTAQERDRKGSKTKKPKSSKKTKDLPLYDPDPDPSQPGIGLFIIRITNSFGQYVGCLRALSSGRFVADKDINLDDLSKTDEEFIFEHQLCRKKARGADCEFSGLRNMKFQKYLSRPHVGAKLQGTSRMSDDECLNTRRPQWLFFKDKFKESCTVTFAAHSLQLAVSKTTSPLNFEMIPLGDAEDDILSAKVDALLQGDGKGAFFSLPNKEKLTAKGK